MRWRDISPGEARARIGQIAQAFIASYRNGLLQATEVVKLVTGAGEPLVGRLLLYEALGATFTELKVRRDPNCEICSKDPSEISDEEMGVFPDYEAFCAAAG